VGLKAFPLALASMPLDVEPTDYFMLVKLSVSDTEIILAHLPERIRTALIARAAEIEYPIEAVVEMAFTKCF
jgi:hypothetical protein